MIFRAVLSNKQHPGYGVATVPFPIKNEDYESIVELLRPLNIGGAMKRDCRIVEIRSDLTILGQMEMTDANLDELDYLAKRLDGFDPYEQTQFLATLSHLNLYGVDELINLTFCCQEATVITDFANLESAGRRHFLTMNGGGAPLEDVERIDAVALIKALISYETGHITPYGVVYDNGMQLTQLYDGKHLPGYHYEEDVLAVGISSRREPEDTDKITWLYLPCSRLQIERGIERSGITDPEEMRFWYEYSALPTEIEAVLESKWEDLYELNDMAAEIKKLSVEDRKKLGAVVLMAKPECAAQVRHLAENLDLFDFAPGAKTVEDYGRYKMQNSEEFNYDEGFAEYYNYEKYGKERIAQENGEFNACGYVAYHGFVSMEELMGGVPSERMGFQMEGF